METFLGMEAFLSPRKLSRRIVFTGVRLSGKLVSGQMNGRSPKKGDLKQCANYRTIALVSLANKILLRIILETIRVKTETEIADKQAGFRQGRGTREDMEKSQHTDFNKDTTDEGASVACSNIRL